MQADLFLQTIVCDYVFDKDKIFAYLNLDDNELFIYQRLYDLLARDLPQPDLVVYLQSPTEVLRRRVRGRRISAWSHLVRKSSPDLSSRSRRIWTPSTATVSPLCVSARANTARA